MIKELVEKLFAKKENSAIPTCPYCGATMKSFDINGDLNGSNIHGYDRWDCPGCPRYDWHIPGFMIFINNKTQETIRHIKTLENYELVSTFTPFPAGTPASYIKDNEMIVYFSGSQHNESVIIPKAYRLDEPDEIPKILEIVKLYTIFS